MALQEERSTLRVPALIWAMLPLRRLRECVPIQNVRESITHRLAFVQRNKAIKRINCLLSLFDYLFQRQLTNRLHSCRILPRTPRVLSLIYFISVSVCKDFSKNSLFNSQKEKPLIFKRRSIVTSSRNQSHLDAQ